MKRLILLAASLLTAAGCSLPTGPDDAAEVAAARAALEAASHHGINAKIALN